MRAYRIGLMVSAALHTGVIAAVGLLEENPKQAGERAPLMLATFAQVAAPPPVTEVPPAPPQAKPEQAPALRPPVPSESPETPEPEPKPVESAGPAPGEPVAAPEPTSKPEPALSPFNPAPSVRVEERYLAALRKAIEANKYYPRRARHLGMEGQTLVSFVLRRDGGISDVTVAEGSGQAMLDRAATDAVQAVGHFEPPPTEIARDTWPIEVVIGFSLR